MSPELERLGLTGFLIFCRVGACLMLMIGFASARVPVLIRLLIALAVSWALAPLLWPAVTAVLDSAPAPSRLLLVLTELAIGVSMGLLCRVFLAGLQFGAAVAANAIGLAGIPGMPIDDAEPQPALVTFLSLSATMVIFAADLHLQVLRSLIESYETLPPALTFDFGRMTQRIETQLTEVFAMSLRLCAPFIIFAVLMNFAIGLVNKFTPQISVYFASLGLVTALGLFLLWATADEWLLLFAAEYAAFLRDW